MDFLYSSSINSHIGISSALKALLPHSLQTRLPSGLYDWPGTDSVLLNFWTWPQKARGLLRPTLLPLPPGTFPHPIKFSAKACLPLASKLTMSLVHDLLLNNGYCPPTNSAGASSARYNVPTLWTVFLKVPTEVSPKTWPYSWERENVWQIFHLESKEPETKVSSSQMI